MEGLNQGFQLLQTCFAHGGTAVVKFDIAEFLSMTKQRTQNGKWRRGSLSNKIAYHLDHNLPDAELRIIEASGYRNIQVYISLSVLQKSDGQLHREFGRLRAFHTIAENKLIEEYLIFGIQLFSHYQILQIKGELALPDAVAGIFPRIR